MFFKYWFLLTKSLAIDGGMINKFRKSGQSIYNDHPTWDIEIKLHLSTSLALVLSLDKVVIKQMQSTMTKAVEHGLDKSAGLNFTFINCDKIENVTMGFEHRLMIGPLKWYDLGDDYRIETYSPLNHERKLVSGIIHGMHLQILDINRENIVFDSGQIVLNIVVYKGSKFKLIFFLSSCVG